METLQIGIDLFLQHCEFERNFSKHTIKAYRLDLTQFRRVARGELHGDNLTGINRLLLRGYAQHLHKYKPASQRRKLAALKSLFAFLEREGYVDPNPAHHIRLDVRAGRL